MWIKILYFSRFGPQVKKYIFGSLETAIFGSFETVIFGSFETAIFGSFETESWLEDRKIFRFQKPFLCSFDTPQKRCFKTSSMPAF